MKILYLHIGTPKTATTAIQTFCFHNRPALESHGFCYARMGKGFSYPGTGGARNGRFLTTWLYDEEGNRRKEEEEWRFKNGLLRLEEQFRTFDRLIVSDEGIWIGALVRRPTLWEELKNWSEHAGVQIQVIVYLRRQDQFLESQWNQQVKHLKGTQGWAAYRKKHMKAPELDYWAALNRISDVFGQENIVVRRFQKADFVGGSILSDFLSVLGLKLTENYDMSSQRERQNTRLEGNLTELKRVTNSLRDLSREEEQFLKGAALRCSVPARKAYRCDMQTPEEAQSLIRPFEEGNERVAETWLKDGAPLFNQSFSDAPKWKKDNPWLLDDAVRYSAMTDVLLLRRIEALEEEVRLDRRENELLKKDLKHPLRTILRKLRRFFRQVGGTRNG